MTMDNWLKAAIADAKSRGLDIAPLLEALARATTALRAADFNDDAAGPLAANSRSAPV